MSIYSKAEKEANRILGDRPVKPEKFCTPEEWLAYEKSLDHYRREWDHIFLHETVMELDRRNAE